MTNLPGQQATLSGCVDRELEQHLYNSISDNTPVFTPEPNEDEIMTLSRIGLPSDTPWTPEEWSFSSSHKNGGESMVQYSNRMLDLADECDLNDITQQEIMTMIFICGCQSPQFRKELRRHGVGVSWQFKKKEADKALNVTKKPSQATNRSQARNPRKTNPSPKKEKVEVFFRGKCRRCGSPVPTQKDCKVLPDMECRNCNKAGHLAKICASHIFSPLTAEQQQRRNMVANMIEQRENSLDEEQQASALAVSRRVCNACPIYRC